VWLIKTGLQAAPSATLVSVKRLLTLASTKPDQDWALQQALAAQAAFRCLLRRATASWQAA
jgi:hypothetical protein